MYTYDAYVEGCHFISPTIVLPFIDKFESNGYRCYYEPRDALVGDLIVNQIESNMRISRSLIIIYHDSFFDSYWAKFIIAVGKQIKHVNRKFKLIVVADIPIPAEYSSYFKLFSPITITKHYEETTYQQILKILTETGISLFV